MTKNRRISFEKETFIYIFLILILVLMFMPFMTTFNDLLIRVVMRLDFYRVIQNVVVPWEVRMVGVLLLPFGFKPAVVGDYLLIGGPSTLFSRSGQSQLLVEIVWNCIGWQSLLFFLITAFVGLQGDKYTNLSKFKALIIGLLGTFLVNLLRIAIVALVAYWFGQSVAIIFHDYGSTLAVLTWLFFFWWFAYSFVLETKDN
jgi:exosortase/archaeosortase family protein